MADDGENSSLELEENGRENRIDPQLRLMLLSQRLTALKRQREHNVTTKDEVGKLANDASASTKIGDDSECDRGEDEGIDGVLDKNVDDDPRDSQVFKPASLPLKHELLNKHHQLIHGGKQTDVNYGGDESEGTDDDDNDGGDKPIDEKFGLKESAVTGRRSDEISATIGNLEERPNARMSSHIDLSYLEGDEEVGGMKQKFGSKSRPTLKIPLVNKVHKESSESQIRDKSKAFSRLAEDYLYPEFLHDIRRTHQHNLVFDDDNDYRYHSLSEATMSDDEMIKRKIDSSNESPSDEKMHFVKKKSARRTKSAKRARSGSDVKLKQTISGVLLELSEDADVETFFHGCVCAFPWKCGSSPLSAVVSESAPMNAHLSERCKKRNGGNDLRTFDDNLIGWMPHRNLKSTRRGLGRSEGRNALSEREFSRRRKYDLFSIHRNKGDSAKYAFKHYQDWQAYVDEYRRDYTVNQTGMGMNSHPIPEGGGRREAVVIVRTLSENLRPKLQECNLPDWDDFTDLSTTPMRPLHLGPSYRSGKLPDLGVTWLSASAPAPAHHHDALPEYRYPTSRNVKLTTLRHSEIMASLNKKRQSSPTDHTVHQRRSMEAITPHDAGVNIPAEPLHVVEDFRKSPKRDQYGTDMRPIGYRFLASWRPSESTRVKSANASSKCRRPKDDAKIRDGVTVSDGSVQQEKFGNSLKPLMNGSSEPISQTRAGLLKLFMPPKGLDMSPPETDVDNKPRKHKLVPRTKKIDAPSTGADPVFSSKSHDLEEKNAISKSSAAAKSVDVSKWISLPSSRSEEQGDSRCGERRQSGNGANKKSASKSKALHTDEKSTAEKRSATKSGTLARRPVMKSHVEDRVSQRELLHVRGENKREKHINGTEVTVDAGPETSTGVKEKDGGVFGKARIKLVAPYAQPLSQDNVLVGSPYGASPPFRNEEPGTTLQSTG